MNHNPTTSHTLARRGPILAAAASLLFASCLFAQTSAPTTKVPSSQVSPEENPPKATIKKIHSLKFEGHEAWDLNYALRGQLSAENVVVTGTAWRMPMPAFELRNVTLTEIAHTIEFLSEGKLRVEVLENPGGGAVWLIGANNFAAAAASVKMRAVAAPNLFADDKAVSEIQEAAEAMQLARARMATVYRGGDFARGASLEPLKSQKIFVVTGDEAGVAGLESLIKAAEQRLADASAANVASLSANAPKMRAVPAPHIFAKERRWKEMLVLAEKTRGSWADLNSELLKASGSERSPAFRFALPWVKVDPRAEQKVFILMGTEAAIAGMESLINAAEKLAAGEDAADASPNIITEEQEKAMKARKESKLKAAEEAAKKDGSAK